MAGYRRLHAEERRRKARDAANVVLDPKSGMGAEVDALNRLVALDREGALAITEFLAGNPHPSPVGRSLVMDAAEKNASYWGFLPRPRCRKNDRYTVQGPPPRDD
jgi:hypothetical protein